MTLIRFKECGEKMNFEDLRASAAFTSEGVLYLRDGLTNTAYNTLTGTNASIADEAVVYYQPFLSFDTTGWDQLESRATPVKGIWSIDSSAQAVAISKEVKKRSKMLAPDIDSIKLLMIERLIREDELPELTGLSPSTIYNLLKRRSLLFTTKTMEKVADGLGVSLDEICIEG